MTSETTRASSRLRRLLSFLEPTLVAVALAAIAVGALDAIAAGQARWSTVAIGFIAVGFGLPLAILGVIARAAFAAWWPPPPDNANDPDDPRRAAGLLVTVAALTIGLIFIFNASYMAFTAFRARTAAAFATAAAAAAVAIALVGLAPLSTRALARPLSAIAKRLPARAARALTGRGLPMVLLVIGAFVGWGLFRFWLSPRLEYVSYAWLRLAVLGSLVIVGVHAAWPLLESRRRLIEIVCGLLIVGSIASAVVIRYTSPRTMLEMWGESAVASEAIETLVDLSPLHDEYGTEAPEQRPDATRPDVVVITIDTWRADRVPEFGVATAQMPRFKEFAKKSVRFRSALTPSNNTRRSLPAIMMGLPSAQVRGRIRGWSLVLDPRHSMLADYFRASGYETAGFFCCESLFGRARGTGYYRGIDKLRVNKRTHELVDEIAEYLKRLDSKPSGRKPIFVWIHLIEPHRWNRSRKQPKPAVARARYDRTLVALDPMLGQILEATSKHARADHTVVAISSDHGEGLGDHNILEHQRGLYDAIIRVPFAIRAPGLAPRVIEDPVSVASLAPTLLDIAGFVPPEVMKKPSLLPLLRGGPPPSEVFAEQIRDRSVRRSQHALVSDGFKLIVGPGRKRRLFERSSDPRELKNLAGARRDIVEKMERRIEELRRQHRFPVW